MIMSGVQNDDHSLVELSGTLAFRDLLRFQYFHSYRRTWWIIALMLLGTLVGVLLTVVAVLPNSDFELARRSGTWFLLLLIFWVVIVTTPYRGAKRLMKTNASVSAPITWIFSSRGMHRTGLRFSSEISYEALWAVRETKSLYLLNLSAASALLLPKRFFRDAVQQNDWRIFVEQRISPKRITRLGLLGRWL
jgi:hypothetical protein